MSLEYIYAFAIILLVILITGSLFTIFFLKQAARKWFKSSSPLMLLLPIIGLTALITSLLALFYSVENSFTQNYRANLPDYKYMTFKYSPVSGNSDSLAGFTKDEIQNWKDKNNISFEGESDVVTGSATLDLSGLLHFSKVRVIGLDGISDPLVYAANSHFGGTTKITNPYNGKSINEIIDAKKQQNNNLQSFLGPEFNDSVTLIVNIDDARTLFDLDKNQYNAVLTKNEKGTSATNDFLILNLEEKFKTVYNDNLPILVYIFIGAIPFIALIVVLFSTVKNYIKINKKEFVLFKSYGMVSDVLTIFMVQKLIPVIILGIIAGIGFGLAWGRFVSAYLFDYYASFNNALLIPDLFKPKYYLSWDIVLGALAISFSLILLAIYFSSTYLLTKNAAQLNKEDFAFRNSNRYIKSALNFSNIFFIVIAIILLFNAFFLDNKTFSATDQQALKGALLFMGLGIFFLAIKRFVLSRVNFNHSERIYSAVLFVLIALSPLLPFFSNTFKNWPVFYVILVIFSLISLAYIIKNKLVFGLLVLLILLGATFTGTLLVDNFTNKITTLGNNTHIIFKESTGADFTNVLIPSVVKNISKSSNALIDLPDFKQKDFSDRYQDIKDDTLVFNTSLLGLNQVAFNNTNFIFKDTRSDLKTKNDVVNALFNEKEAVAIGRFYSMNEAKAFVPTLKIGDEVKMKLSYSKDAPVVTKKIIAIIESPDYVNDSFIMSDEAVIRDLALKNPSNVYAIELSENANLETIRNDLLASNLHEYNDYLQSRTTISNQAKALINTLFYEELMGFGLLIAQLLLTNVIFRKYNEKISLSSEQSAKE